MSERKRSVSHTQSLANNWSGSPCTLDGRPAKITGRLNPFATVASLDPSYPAAEFSWEAVNRVMWTDAKFVS